MITKTVTLLILVMLISTVYAAPGNDSVVIDKTKETLKEIDKGIQVRDTSADIAKYDVLKEKDKITISKTDTVKDKKVEHTKTKLVMDKKTARSIDIDKDGKFGYLRKVNGRVVDIKVVTLAELTTGIDATFSEVIVSGYSGYKQYTFSDVESGDILNIDDVSGNYTITAAVGGVVPTYTAIDEHNISTYPDAGNLISVMLMDNSTDIVDSVVYTSTNVSYADGIAQFNGIDSKIGLSNVKYNVAYPLLNVRFSDIPSIDNREIFGKMVYASKVGYRIVRESSELRFYVGNSTLATFSKIPISTLHEGDMISCAYNGTKTFVYLNGVLYDSDSLHGPIVNSGNSAVIGSTYYSSYQKMGVIDFVMYNSSLISTTNLKSLYAGGSGISFQPEPSYNFTGYNVASGVEKVIYTDSTCTGLEYVDTTGGTHDVTVTVYFTEDITVISDSHTATMQTVNISHTSTNTADNGSIIPYEILDGYDGMAVLTTNNTNASISQNETHFIISTGYISSGSTYYYLVKIPTIRITSYTPANNNVSNLYNENTLYTVHVSEASDIVWMIDNSTYKTVSSVTYDSLNYGSTFNVGMHNITVNIINSYGDLTDSNTWNVDVYTNSFQNIGSSLSDDINEAYLIMGTMLILIIGLAIIGLLASAYNGHIDYITAILSIMVFILIGTIMVIGLTLLSALMGMIK